MVYRFFNSIKTGKVVCRESDPDKGQKQYFNDYSKITKDLLRNAVWVTKLKSQNKKDLRFGVIRILKYEINADTIVFQNYHELFKTKKIREFYSKILNKTNRCIFNKEWFEKNKKIIIKTGVTVVLSASIAISGVMAKSNSDLIPEENSYSYHFMDSDNEDSDKLLYEINLECGSKLGECQEFFENNVDEDSIINKYSECYGVDCNLIKAIAYQESRGNHNVTSNPCAYGIMQIENVHIGSTIQSYNFITNQTDSIKITEEVLKNKEKNIQVGIMIYRNNLNAFNNNPILALQAYNFGVGGLKQVLKIAGDNNNMDINDFINNPTNLMWLDYRSEYPYGGDKKYTENVMRFCTDTIQNLERNNNIIEFKFDGYTKNKKK